MSARTEAEMRNELAMLQKRGEGGSPRASELNHFIRQAAQATLQAADARPRAAVREMVAAVAATPPSRAVVPPKPDPVRAEYARLQRTNPMAAAAYAQRHGGHLFPGGSPPEAA